MDAEHLRDQLRLAAADLPPAAPGQRDAVARRIRRKRRTTSTLVAAAVLVLVVVAGVAVRWTVTVDTSVNFVDTPPASPSVAARADCHTTPPPFDADGQRVAIYLPCPAADTVARVDRWIVDPSPASLVRAVLDGPTARERRAGRGALFDGPAAGLLTDVVVDGDGTARVVLNDSVDGLSSALDDGARLIEAVTTTLFTAGPVAGHAVERVVFAMDDGPAFCDVVGLPAGCDAVDRSAWARRPDGWRPAPAIPPDEMGTFGGTAPTGPLSVDGMDIFAAGLGAGSVNAVDTTGARRDWTVDLGVPAAFVADQPLGDSAVLVAPMFAQVRALAVADGTTRWRLALDDAQAPGDPAVAGSTVYVPVSHTVEGDRRAPTVRALDAATGVARWTATLREGTELQWAPPTVTDDLVIVADTPDVLRGRSQLHALDRRDGTPVWTYTFPTREQGFDHEQPLVHDGAVFAVSDGELYALELGSGELRWRRPVSHVHGVLPGQVVVEVDAAVTALDAATGEPVPAE